MLTGLEVEQKIQGTGSEDQVPFLLCRNKLSPREAGNFQSGFRYSANGKRENFSNQCLFSDQMSRSRRLNLCSFGAERSDCRIPVFFADGQYVEGIKSALIESGAERTSSKRTASGHF
jgi:hypothetical protein